MFSKSSGERRADGAVARSSRSVTLKGFAGGALILVGAGAYLTHYKTALSPFATPPSCDATRVEGNLKKIYSRAMKRWQVQRKDIVVKQASPVEWQGEGRRCQADLVIRRQYRVKATYSIKWVDRVSRKYEVRLLTSRVIRT